MTINISFMVDEYQCKECGSQIHSEDNACSQCGNMLRGENVSKTVDNAEISNFDKFKKSINEMYKNLNNKLNKVATRINIRVNKILLSIQVKIDRYRLTRRYNRKKREEEKLNREIKTQQDHELKKQELLKMEEASQKVYPATEDKTVITNEVSSEKIQEQLDLLDNLETSEENNEQLTKNPLRQFSIIQIIVSLSFLVIGVFSTIAVTGLVIIEDFMPLFSLIFTGVLFGIIFWRYFFNRYYAKILKFLIMGRFTRKIIAGGSFSFYEHKDPSTERIMSKVTEPVGMIISTLISMLALATTVIGVLRSIKPDLDLVNPLLWGVLSLLIPVFATPIVPVIWGLQDARVKSYNTGARTNWLVSAKYKARFNSLISIGAIASNLSQGSVTSISGILEQLEILYSILRVGIFIVLISVGFLVLFYYLGFRGYLRRITINSLEIKTYEILLNELDVPQFQPITKNNDETTK